MGVPDFPFSMGYTVMCEEASIDFGSEGMHIYTRGGEVITPELNPDNGWIREIDYFVSSITGQKKPEIVTPVQAREAVEIVCAEIESVNCGKEIML